MGWGGRRGRGVGAATTRSGHRSRRRVLIGMVEWRGGTSAAEAVAAGRGVPVILEGAWEEGRALHVAI